ncbi:MAG TPA: hypothetical protein PLL10_01005, partial [Elusimicrobiales bacterium]|nr:hypothetical protein [Elusimicrobiales bacterium]
MRLPAAVPLCVALLGCCRAAASAAPDYCFSDPDKCAAYYLALSSSSDAKERFAAHRELAVLNYDKGELKQAVKHYDAALALHP